MGLSSRAARVAGMMGYFFETRFLNRHIPLMASFKLTYRCNLSCLGCPFHRSPAAKDSSIGWIQATQSLIDLRRMGCRIVIFEGGEPLLWKDGPKGFSDLLLYARKHFICTGATTNGTFPLDVPSDVLWISIDGLKQTHDELRSASWDTIMKNIHSSKHPKLFVHYTLNSRNWKDFAPAAEVLCSLEQIKGITVQFFYPYRQGEDDLTLSPAERKAAVNSILALKRTGYPIMNSSRSLRSMISNIWRCRDWMLANVEPDGSITKGCYLKNRGEIRCIDCGFTPVSEAAGALDLKPGSLISGWRLFIS